MKFMDMGLKRTATLPQVITEVVELGQVLPSTMTLLIEEDMLIEVNIVRKRPATLPIAV